PRRAFPAVPEEGDEGRTPRIVTGVVPRATETGSGPTSSPRLRDVIRHDGRELECDSEVAGRTGGGVGHPVHRRHAKRAHPALVEEGGGDQSALDLEADDLEDGGDGVAGE